MLFLAHKIRLSEILPWDRKSYLTHSILPRTSSNVIIYNCILAYSRVLLEAFFPLETKYLQHLSAQLFHYIYKMVASVSGVVLGGVAEVVGSNLARGKIFTASIGSVVSLYPSVFIYCLNLHQFLILCSSKAMMFVKLYFRTSDIYLISLVSLDPSGFHLRTK